MGTYAPHQELCVDQCSFGSHNYATDSSHQDERIHLNGMFCPPHNVGQTACIAQVMEDGGRAPRQSDTREVPFPGVVVGGDESQTLIVDKPVVAHHFLGIDISLREPGGHSRT
eukprot:1701435-Pyramimonas_sp.AAC.1